VRARIDRFCQWCGSELRIGELTNELVNDWLADLAAGGMNPQTLSGYKASLRCVWRSAFEAGDNQHAPLRLRRIKKRALIIQAYRHDELKRILDYMATLDGTHPDGNKRSDFWQAAVHCGYCLASRRGDLLTLRRDQFDDNGVVRYVQHKTGFANGGKLSIEAMYFVRRLASNGPLLPFPFKRACFSRTFKRLRKAAGIERGSFKWVRRSSASYAELQRAGDGSRLLGHRCESVFRQHYDDSSITGAVPVSPPPLGAV
jgi:integrase